MEAVSGPGSQRRRECQPCCPGGGCLPHYYPARGQSIGGLQELEPAILLVRTTNLPGSPRETPRTTNAGWAAVCCSRFVTPIFLASVGVPWKERTTERRATAPWTCAHPAQRRCAPAPRLSDSYSVKRTGSRCLSTNYYSKIITSVPKYVFFSYSAPYATPSRTLALAPVR